MRGEDGGHGAARLCPPYNPCSSGLHTFTASQDDGAVVATQWDQLLLRVRALVGACVDRLDDVLFALDLRVHIKGALVNGVSKDEIRELFMQVACYAGIPAGVDSFRIAREVFAEMEKS